AQFHVDNVKVVTPSIGQGILTANGNVSFDAASSLVLQLNGGIPGTGYSQLVVHGTVSIDSAQLLASLGYTPVAGDVVKLIDNDGTADPVSGSFSGYPEGTVFDLGNTKYRITYAGGDGNDVTLLALRQVSAQ